MRKQGPHRKSRLCGLCDLCGFFSRVSPTSTSVRRRSSSSRRPDLARSDRRTLQSARIEVGAEDVLIRRTGALPNFTISTFFMPGAVAGSEPARNPVRPPAEQIANDSSFASDRREDVAIASSPRSSTSAARPRSNPSRRAMTAFRCAGDSASRSRNSAVPCSSSRMVWTKATISRRSLRVGRRRRCRRSRRAARVSRSSEYWWQAKRISSLFLK